MLKTGCKLTGVEGRWVVFLRRSESREMRPSLPLFSLVIVFAGLGVGYLTNSIAADFAGERAQLRRKGTC